ncbi:hypothetical protein [Algoriphagus boritolerans]|uniref:metallophosphoesterase family protein n=1 Tax=Algoriphagus boritolerans TaxID=308111 RepID=UPI002FCDFADF
MEEVLSSNPKSWTIVTYHHPLFSASNGRDNEALRNLWKPIFDKYRVDIALQGHDHAYARGRVAPGENVMNGVNMKDLTGTVYVVSVSGGKMYDIGDDWTEKGGQRDRTAENTQLFQVITMEGNRLKFESFTAVGELYDAFELVKGENDLNQFIELRVNAVPEKNPFQYGALQGLNQGKNKISNSGSDQGQKKNSALRFESDWISTFPTHQILLPSASWDEWPIAQWPCIQENRL